MHARPAPCWRRTRSQYAIAPCRPHATVEESVRKLALAAGDGLLQRLLPMLRDIGGDLRFVFGRRRPRCRNDEVVHGAVGKGWAPAAWRNRGSCDSCRRCPRSSGADARTRTDSAHARRRPGRQLHARPRRIPRRAATRPGSRTRRILRHHACPRSAPALRKRDASPSVATSMESSSPAAPRAAGWMWRFTAMRCAVAAAKNLSRASA